MLFIEKIQILQAYSEKCYPFESYLQFHSTIYLTSIIIKQIAVTILFADVMGRISDFTLDDCTSYYNENIWFINFWNRSSALTK